MTRTPKQQEALDALALHGSHRKAAKALGVALSTLQERLDRARANLSAGALQAVESAGLSPLEAKGGWIHNYDDGGKKTGTTRWAPEAVPPEDIADRIIGRMNTIITAPTIIRPATVRYDLLNFLPVFDVHLGQRVGSFGTAQAVVRLREGVRDVIDRAPKTAQTVILIGGDYSEANDNSALTPQSKHPLAVDTDFDDLSDVAVDLLVDMVEYALSASDQVLLKVLRGNHDPAMAVALRAALRQRYLRNPRLSIQDGHRLFVHSWEGNFICGLHGDEKVTKAETLALGLAARYRAEWGAAKRGELWLGHTHKEIIVSVPGMRVNRVNPICPPGRYANDNLFTGESDIQCVTYRKGGGRAGCHTHIFEDVFA